MMIVIEIVPQSRKPIGRPKEDGLRNDLTRLGAWKNWRETGEDGRDWRALIVSSCSIRTGTLYSVLFYHNIYFEQRNVQYLSLLAVQPVT